ncbi:MAG: helix-turn-helix domain-containing protein [Pseudomonadota bacterium]
MSETETKILDAAIRTFLRYGAKKTSMNDIAEAAGVSRQTLYDLFGGKDELIQASTRAITDKKLSSVRARLKPEMSLRVQLEVYLEGTVVESWEALRAAGDAEELVAGYHEAGKEEIARSHERHVDLLEEIFAPFARPLATYGLEPREQAHFVMSTAMGLKTGASSRAELDALLKSLVANCLSVAAD